MICTKPQAFWCGFEGDLRLQGVNDASLRVSIRPYDCNADGVAALDNFREKVSERKPSKRVLHIRDAEASEALPSNGADSLGRTGGQLWLVPFL